MELKLKNLTRSQVMTVAGAGLCCFVIAFGLNAFTSQQRLEALELEQVRQDAETNRINTQVSEHVHTWVPSTSTIRHDAKTTEVEHQPIYDLQTTYHTVCNECEAIIDGHAMEHIHDTGHAGYSTNVPVSVEVLRQAGYTETVILEDAWSEMITDGVICTSCGEKRSSEEAESLSVEPAANATKPKPIDA